MAFCATTDRHLLKVTANTCLLVLQFMSIESTGKRVLFFRGYIGMAVALGLLVITISLQVSHHSLPGTIISTMYCHSMHEASVIMGLFVSSSLTNHESLQSFVLADLSLFHHEL